MWGEIGGGNFRWVRQMYSGHYLTVWVWNLIERRLLHGSNFSNIETPQPRQRELGLELMGNDNYLSCQSTRILCIISHTNSTWDKVVDIDYQSAPSSGIDVIYSKPNGEGGRVVPLDVQASSSSRSQPRKIMRFLHVEEALQRNHQSHRQIF